MRVELEEPYVLIHEKKLGNVQAMLPVCEKTDFAWGWNAQTGE